MQLITRVARDKNGVACIATITVYEADGVTPATLFDVLGASLTSTFTTDAVGAYQFQVADGTYVIQMVYATGSHKETLEVYDAAIGDSPLLLNAGETIEVNAWYPTPVTGVLTGSTVVFDWTLGQHQHYVLTVAGRVIVPTNIPIGAALVIDLIDADQFPPDISQLSPLGENEVTVVFGEITRLIITRNADGALRCGTGQWWLTPGPWYGDIGLVGGGYNATPVTTSVIESVDLTTPSDGVSFGTLSAARKQPAAGSNGTTALFAGGVENRSRLDYVVFSVPSAATIFGSLTTPRNYLAGASSESVTLFGGGATGTISETLPKSSVIEVVDITVPGDGQFFGNLLIARNALLGGGNGVNALFIGGYSTANITDMDRVSFYTPADAVDHGDLATIAGGVSGASNEEMMVVAGGGNAVGYLSAIEKVVFETPGSAGTFGNILTPRVRTANCSNAEYVFIMGGYDSANTLSDIEYISFSTLANAVVFGNLTTAVMYTAGCSGN